MTDFSGSNIATLIAGILFLSVGFANSSYFDEVAKNEEKGGGSCGVPKGQSRVMSNLNFLLGWFGVIVAGIAVLKMIFGVKGAPATVTI